jgi:hypothetical protein
VFTGASASFEGFEIWYVLRMPLSKKLEDAYRFPGFRPLPTVQGIFGDAHARVVTLTRREKKQSAVLAAWSTEASTTGSGGVYETFLAEDSAFSWTWRCAASSVGAAAR